MLDSLFVIFLIITVIFQIIAVYEKSIIFTMSSLIFWLVLMANSLFIEVPYTVGYLNDTGDINIISQSHSYTDYGLSALCLIFVFVNILLMIMNYTQWKEESQIP